MHGFRMSEAWEAVIDAGRAHPFTVVWLNMRTQKRLIGEALRKPFTAMSLEINDYLKSRRNPLNAIAYQPVKQ